MKITLNTIYFTLLFVVILITINITIVQRQLDRIEQQLAVCLPASQHEGGAE